MKLQSLALAALLAACAAPNGNNQAVADSNQPADVPIQGGSNPPTAPAAPSPGQPAPGQPAPVPTGSVSLSAAPPRAAPGSTMTLSLRNGSSQTIGYHLCTSVLKNAAGAPVRSDRVCTMELRTLGPGTTATDPWDLPADLAAGSYRFTTTIEWMDSNRRTNVDSNSFELVRR